MMNVVPELDLSKHTVEVDAKHYFRLSPILMTFPWARRTPNWYSFFCDHPESMLFYKCRVDNAVWAAVHENGREGLENEGRWRVTLLDAWGSPVAYKAHDYLEYLQKDFFMLVENIPEPEFEFVGALNMNDDLQKSAIETIVDLTLIKGGKGSGNFGHAGRPGKVGGSAPRSTTRVGVTSSREGVSSRSVFVAMGEFEQDLKRVRGVSGINVQPGLGGWEGGREPTWIVEYKGNGEALELLQDVGRKYDQDAILLFSEAKKGSGSLMLDYILNDSVQPVERDIIEDAVTANGIGGWSWYRTPDGRRSLRLVHVPQWAGDEAAFVSGTKGLITFLNENDFTHTLNTGRVDVTIMERDDDYAMKERLTSDLSARNDVEWEKKLPMLPKLPKGDFKHAVIINRRR